MNTARTYLDHNASSPLRPEARTAMLVALETAGNPSSVHAEGRAARALIEAAREKVARLVNAEPSQVVFTSGATEANNWMMSAGWELICVSAIEHDSIMAPARASGAEVVVMPVSRDGVVDVSAAAPSLASTTKGRALVTVMAANNETGVVQPIADAVALARGHSAMVHIDAVQAPGRMVVDFAALGADTLALSAHKLGGPLGVGALITREAPVALLRGGGQERRRRGGTENVAGIAGFGAAAEAVAREQDAAQRMANLRAALEDGVLAITPGAEIVGSNIARIANTSCIALPGSLAETLVIKLDLAGIAVSAGAACSSGKVASSHVLDAMGYAPEMARAAIRVSLGPQTSEQDIAAFLAAWQKIARPVAIAA